MNPSSRAKRAQLVPRLLILLAGVVGALLLAEVASRVVPGAPPPVVLVRDPETGFRGFAGNTGVWTLENRAHFRYNSMGFRDKEWAASRSKPIRVAVLGDSFVEALQVESNERFTDILEARHKDYEVLNCGISGYGQVEEMLAFRNVISRLKPDFVILAFFPGNDPINNWERRVPTPDYPVSVAPARGGVTVSSNPGAGRISPPRKAFEWLLAHSSLLRRMDQVRKTTLHLRLPDHLGHGIWKGAYGNATRTIRDFDGMWSLTESLLLQISADVARETGRADRFLVVCLTTAAQVQERDRAALLTKDPSLDPDYAEKRLTGFCAANAIPILSLGPDMRSFHEKTGKNVHGFAGKDGHYNPDGHGVVADAIDKRIGEMVGTQLPGSLP